MCFQMNHFHSNCKHKGKKRRVTRITTLIAYKERQMGKKDSNGIIDGCIIKRNKTNDKEHEIKTDRKKKKNSKKCRPGKVKA